MANMGGGGKVPIEKIAISDPQITIRPGNPNRIKKAKSA